MTLSKPSWTYRDARGRSRVVAFLSFVIPGQPAGLNPESRDYKLEIPGSRSRAPRNDVDSQRQIVVLLRGHFHLLVPQHRQRARSGASSSAA
jgi:hypothetical protein